ncbi:glycoside hydrolase family 108 protein [Telmatospirillum sp. J64-1]|uniref:glycoside hydrolase family 108 protein n=1 Tax=Telmatospirillum sp. J64-1 TaxID=2502183 RepID=UPI00115F2A73|nr:glycosyl hydrolase 108 family protein [Telmatospirillum sp. J64-1]
MSLKTKIIDQVIGREKGYVNDPLDLGGETNWGVTEGVARAYGYHGPMKDMPRHVAEAVYADLYWNCLRLDDVEAISPEIAAELADTGINMGVGMAGRFLQRALNAFNDRGRLWPDLVVDGLVGPRTIGALHEYARRRADQGRRMMIDVMLAALNAQQGHRYIDISEERQENQRFTFGWFAHRVVTPALSL